MKLSKLIIGLVTLFIFFSSCSNDDFDKRTVIPEAEWKQENRVAFDVDINDTISPYEFGIGLRHLENYRYSNLFVFLHTTMPNGNHTHDTIECTLATPEGKWIGKSSGSMRDLTVPLNENLLFPLSGTKKKTEPNKSHAIRNLWIIFGSLVLLVILFFIGVATGVFGTMPTFEELENPRTNLATEIYSASRITCLKPSSASRMSASPSTRASTRRPCSVWHTAC